MQAPTGLSRIISNWQQFYQANKSKNLSAICLFGTHYAGKSTLCVLFQRFIENILRQELIFQETKLKLYSYLGVISSNSLKIQTNQPQVYQITSKIQNLPSRTIIDVPASAIAPFNEATKKAWSAIDSKISVAYLLNTLKQCTFALVIQQKWLRAPMDAAKTLILNFLNMFAEHPEQLLNSTCIIVTKCPAGYKLDQCLTRIDGALKKVEDQKIAYEWFDNVRKRNAILMFNKFSTEEHQRKEEIKRIYTALTDLKFYQISQVNKKVLKNLKEDQKNQIKAYLSGLEKGIVQLIKISIQVAQNFVKDKQSFESIKLKAAKDINGAVQQKAIKTETPNLPQILNIGLLCYQLSKLAKQKQKSKDIFKHALIIFVKQGLISETEELYTILKERAQFYQIFWEKQQPLGGWDTYNVWLNIQKQADTIKQLHNLKKLKQSYDAVKQGLTNQALENIVLFIEYFDKADSSELSTMWIDAKLQLASKQPSATALKNFLQIQVKLKQLKNTELLESLFTKIAKILIQLGYVAQAVGFYNKCGNPYQALTTMQDLKKAQNFKKRFRIQNFFPYLKLLQQIGLYEKSYEFCYFLGNQFKEDSERPKLKNYLKNPPKGPENKNIESFITLIATGLDQNQAKRLRQIAQFEQKKISTSK